MKKVTIKDIAKYAGVSTGTVSKVINKQANVKEELRLRVEAIVDKFNFSPSYFARGMKIQRTNTIGLIIPKITNSFYVRVIELIESEANKRDYTIVLGNSNEDIEREISCLKTFLNMRVEGLILASTGRNEALRIKEELSFYEAANIPVALVSRKLPMIERDIVEIENEEGAYKATCHLLEKGHQRVGLISSSDRTSASQERVTGYMKAIEKFRLPYESALVHIGGLTANSGYELANRLISLSNPPTAIFVGSNFQLLGTLRAFKNRKILIPEDISLVCFDDTEWGCFASPPLTAIEPDTVNFSKTAMNLLFDRIENNDSDSARRIKIPTKLIVRESVRTFKKGYLNRRLQWKN